MLTPKQEAFVLAYIETGNASEVAEVHGITFADKPPATGCYVYLLLCPERKRILYVGKGQKQRMFQHTRDVKAGRISGLKKYRALKAYLRAGEVVHPVVLADGLNQTESLRLERAMIARIGTKNLANGISGSRSKWEIGLEMADDALEQLKSYVFTDTSMYRRLADELREVQDMCQRNIVGDAHPKERQA